VSVDERIEDGHRSVSFFKQIGAAVFESFAGNPAAPSTQCNVLHLLYLSDDKVAIAEKILPNLVRGSIYRVNTDESSVKMGAAGRVSGVRQRPIRIPYVDSAAYRDYPPGLEDRVPLAPVAGVSVHPSQLRARLDSREVGSCSAISSTLSG